MVRSFTCYLHFLCAVLAVKAHISTISYQMEFKFKMQERYINIYIFETDTLELFASLKMKHKL